MTLPTYPPVAVPVRAVPYNIDTEAFLITEYGQEAVLALAPEFEKDYVVEDGGVLRKMQNADFHATYHKPTQTADLVKALIEQGVNVTDTARLLRISRPTVYRGLNA